MSTKRHRLIRNSIVVAVAAFVFVGLVYVVQQSHSVTKEEADQLPPIPKNTSDTN